jgi:beta-lactam-binding protein with PASTA domain
MGLEHTWHCTDPRARGMVASGSLNNWYSVRKGSKIALVVASDKKIMEKKRGKFEADLREANLRQV